MKKRCPTCGYPIDIQKDKDIKICQNCNAELDLDILLKTDDQKIIKRKIKINALNKEFKQNQYYFEEETNDLYISYYKLYCAKEINQNIDENKFFKSNYEFIGEENIEVALHMIEHHDLFELSNIEMFINKYIDNPTYYLNILEKTKNKANEKIMEKDLREQLFPYTVIPVGSKKQDPRKNEGKTFVILAIFLYIVLFIAVILTTDKEIIYSMLNLSAIIPTIILTSGLSKIILKINNILKSILLFIVLYYFITLIVTIPYHNEEGFILYTHLKAILYAPLDVIVSISERMGNAK